MCLVGASHGKMLGSEMKVITGDLIELAKKGHFDAIVHGCNCFNNMNGGIAREISREFPEAKAADDKTAKGDRSKMGTTSAAWIVGWARDFVIFNAYTQFHYGGPRMNLDYAALRNCFREIKRAASGCRIGYPKIGAGLAGGDWTKIAPIIDEELAGEDHALVVLPGKS